MKITINEIHRLATINNVNISAFPLSLLLQAFNIEWEHANTVHRDVDTVFKIVLDHLKEIPDYYQRLILMEKSASSFWAKHQKPSLFKAKKNKVTYIRL